MFFTPSRLTLRKDTVDTVQGGIEARQVEAGYHHPEKAKKNVGLQKNIL